MVLCLLLIHPVILKENGTTVSNDTQTAGAFTQPDFKHRGDLEDLLQRRQMIVRQATKLAIFQANTAIAQYYRPLVCVLGLIGNLLSGLVMFQKHNRKISSCTYMGILAFMDSVPLLVNVKYYITDNIVPMYENPIECKVLPFLWVWSALAGAWLIVAMTADKLYVVWKPLKAGHKCTPQRAKMVSFVIIIIAGFVKMPLPIKYLIMLPRLGQDICILSPKRDTPMDELYYWINTMSHSYIPFILLTVMNSIVIHQVRSRRGKQLSLNDLPQAQELKKTKDEFHITVSLVLISVVFLLTTAPVYIVYIVYMFKNPYESANSYATFTIAINSGGRLFLINNAINVFLYGLSGEKFRNDFKCLFGFGIKKKHSNHV